MWARSFSNPANNIQNLVMGLYADFVNKQVIGVTVPMEYDIRPAPNLEYDISLAPEVMPKPLIENGIVTKRSIQVLIINDALNECNNGSPILTLGAAFGDSITKQWEQAKFPGYSF
jgi:hypothetical protein